MRTKLSKAMNSQIFTYKLCEVRNKPKRMAQEKQNGGDLSEIVVDLRIFFGCDVIVTNPHCHAKLLTSSTQKSVKRGLELLIGPGLPN